MVEGIEHVSNLITRYTILEKLYLRTNATAAADGQLKQSIVRLYSAVLEYLAKAARYYNRNTASTFRCSYAPLYARGVLTW
jgi:hypothetical protein